MTELTQGEIAGIRLIADMFVVRELMKNVLAPNGVDAKELEAHLIKKTPKLFLAEVELQKQIQDVRKYWLKALTGENHVSPIAN